MSFKQMKLGLCLLAALQTGASAADSPLLQLDQAIKEAITTTARSGTDPFATLGLRELLPASCLHPALIPVIQEAARSELEHRQTIEVAARFFSIQEQEYRLLALGEMVAATYGHWQKLKAGSDAIADKQATVTTMQAESTYRNTLASREDLRIQLRQEYHLLARSIGVSETFSVDLEPQPDLASTALDDDTKQAPRARQTALSLMDQWWHDTSRNRSSLRSLCRERISDAINAEVSEGHRQDDIARMQIVYLERYAIPAAERQLELASLHLDQARENEPGALRLGQAMTDSLVALGALRAAQNKLHLEHLRYSRDTGIARLNQGDPGKRSN